MASETINFCSAALGTKIFCNQVSSEGYEPENLISDDPFKKSKGFLAGSFVKPPVDLIFQLPCSVNIEQLKIFGRVGNQQTVGIEVLAQSTKPGGYDPFTFGIFTMVSKNFWDANIKGITYKIPLKSNHDPKTVASCGDDVSLHVFTHRQKQLLSAMWSLRLRVIRTANSTIPAISKIEIWGTVSYSNDRDVIERVFELCRSMNMYSLPQIVIKESKISVSEPTCTTGQESLEIPDEFCDSLTYNVMALPVRLPSGNVVDQSTLEQYISNEASWGRPPSDPFTGQVFTKNLKPVHDAGLKARIDEFLSQNSHRKDLRSIPRTVGPVPTSDVALDVPQTTVPHVRRRDDPGPSAPSFTDSSRQLLTNLATSLQCITRKGESRKAIKRPAPVTAPLTGYCCGRSDIIYKLRCLHYTCRSCLVSRKDKETYTCRQCGDSCPVQEAVRFHGP